MLTVKNLQIRFPGVPPVVRGIDFTVRRGETLALVGESGSGKSLTVRTLIGLQPAGAEISAEEMSFSTSETPQIPLERSTFPTLRGTRMGMIFQEATDSLNPVRRVGSQLREALVFHQKISPASAKTRAHELLERVHLRPAARFYRRYPHQLSGGQNQRVAIALALAGPPDLLLADEPPTALDHDVQTDILELLAELRQTQGLTLLLVSHDLALVERIADRILVMQRGVIVERGTTAEIFRHPEHAYTKALLAARPPSSPFPQRSDRDRTPTGEPPASRHRTPGAPPLLTISGLGKTYGERRFFRRAAPVPVLKNFALDLPRGVSVGLLGPSGSGKTTVGKCVLKLVEPDTGSIQFGDVDLTQLTERQFRPYRARLQMVLQNPYAALNPRRRVGDLLAEVVRVHPAKAAPHRSDDLLRTVGLDPERFRARYPRTLSGGERQRVSLARALATQPELLVLDEPVSALDVRARAALIRLLNDLRRDHQLTYLVISHDPTTLAELCDRTVRMNAAS